MADTLVKFRASEVAQIKAADICERLGFDLQTYLRMCMSRLIQENGIPFSMKLEDSPGNRGLAAMEEANRIAEKYGISEMSLEEINAEIAAARGDSN